jgi:hypothetical protein
VFRHSALILPMKATMKLLALQGQDAAIASL